MTQPHEPAARARDGDAAQDGSLKAAISNAMVALLLEHTGRGPTRVRTILHDDTVLVLLEDLLTRAETRLVEGGRAEDVLELRKTIQSSMEDDFVEAIERLTGRTVRAFMSANHADPDLAAELFVLTPAPPG
jgi:uncharacterized protein YbcI